MKGPFKTIDIRGNFSQWNQVELTFKDFVNDILDRDVQGYGELHYTNRTGRNDFERMKVAEDRDNVYFYVKTVAPITKPDNHWMSLLGCYPHAAARTVDKSRYRFLRTFCSGRCRWTALPL